MLRASELVQALESTFRIVEGCLDRWTFDMLGEEIRRQFGPEGWSASRGAILQRSFAHDVSHITELNEYLGRAGLSQVNLWE